MGEPDLDKNQLIFVLSCSPIIGGWGDLSYFRSAASTAFFGLMRRTVFPPT